MKTRLGKIAQLPKSIRDDLNRRLENGKQSPELLAWLNELPETKELLAKFNYQPINKSNLSDWRHGGFLEWLQDQAREARIQRISESGATLENAEAGDLFENFARFAVAELMDDLDSLQKFRGEKRSRALHELIHDLARLQFGYNHSRRTALAWTKYNDSRPRRVAVPPASQPNTTSSPTTAVKPDGAGSCDSQSHDPKPSYDPFKHIYHTRCCDEPCPICHAPDSDYPLDEVLRDREFYKKHGQQPYDRHGRPRHLINTYCECSCERCVEESPLHTVSPPTASPVELDPARNAPLQQPPTHHAEPVEEKPSAPVPTTGPETPAPARHPYSISECLKRISLLEAQRRREPTPTSP